MPTEPLYKFAEIVARLRGGGGCPWDKKQTHESLKPYLIEEAYEVLDAIDSGKKDHIMEELGDLLLQIYLHSQIASENNEFNIDDVASGIIGKIVRRHPHVFGNETAKNPDEVIEKWEKIKKAEKGADSHVLSGVPVNLPALLKAYRVQQKVSRLGFDWKKVRDIFPKLSEELDELKEAVGSNDRSMALEEAGDILFSIVNILRHIDINPEEALRASTAKFIRRFNSMEDMISSEKGEITAMSTDELEEYWKKVKRLENQSQRDL